MAALPASDRAAVTMTAELCDCYPTKAVGVNAILDAVLAGMPGHSIVVWGVDGEFHSVSDARRQPHLAAAANWLALATLAARSIPESRGLLIDIGSTTTDLIPLDRGHVARAGAATPSDFRSASSFMRGCAARQSAHWRPSCRCEGSPPDWPPRSLRRRSMSTSHWERSQPTLAIFRRPTAGPPPSRRPGTDWPGWSAPTATAFLMRMHTRSPAPPTNACSHRLALAAGRAAGPTIGRPAAAVVAGSGELLARRLASRVIEPGGPIVGLKEAWGPVASSAGCAFALVKLAAERFRSDDDRVRES